jgi:hypothetical protein
LTEILKGQPVWMRLSGDSNADTRQKIMTALTGVKTPKNKSGVNAIEAALLKKLGIDTTNTTIDEQGKLITARLNEIAAGAPATTPDEVAPEATSDTSDDLRNAAMVTFKEFSKVLNSLPTKEADGCTCGLARQYTGSESKGAVN